MTTPKPKPEPEPYFDVKVTCLDTHARVQYDRTEPVILRGFYSGPPLSLDEVKAKHTDGESLIQAAVKDNGPFGEGFVLEFIAPLRETNESPPEAVLFGIELTVGQAHMLAEALLTVVRLRRTQQKARHDAAGVSEDDDEDEDE